MRRTAIVCLLLAACGGESETEQTPAAETHPTEPAAPAIDLGPEITLPQAEQAAITAFFAADSEWYRTGTTTFGAPAPYLLDNAANRGRANQLWYIARHSEEPVQIVAALRSLSLWSTHGDPAVPFGADRKQLVLGRLQHADPHVVAGVLDAMQNALREDDDIQARIIELCRTHENVVVRANACNVALGRPRYLGDATETLAAGVEALGDREVLVQIAVLDRLRYNSRLTQYPANTMARIDPLLTSTNPAVRGMAITFALDYTAARVPAQLDRVIERATAALADPDPYVRMRSARGLLDLPNPQKWTMVQRVVPLLEQADVAAAPYRFRGLAFAGSALLGLVQQPADREETYPGSEAAAWGNTVQGLVLYELIGEAQNAPEAHRLAERPASGTEQFPAAKAAFLAWWQAHGAALQAPPAAP